MKVKTIVTFLTKTKIWFATIDENGKLQRDLFGVRPLLLNLIFLTTTSIYLWKILESGLFYSDEE